MIDLTRATLWQLIDYVSSEPPPVRPGENDHRWPLLWREDQWRLKQTIKTPSLLDVGPGYAIEFCFPEVADEGP